MLEGNGFEACLPLPFFLSSLLPLSPFFLFSLLPFSSCHFPISSLYSFLSFLLSPLLPLLPFSRRTRENIRGSRGRRERGEERKRLCLKATVSKLVLLFPSSSLPFFLSPLLPLFSSSSLFLPLRFNFWENIEKRERKKSTSKSRESFPSFPFSRPPLYYVFLSHL
jgi:hypothetical protein